MYGLASARGLNGWHLLLSGLLALGCGASAGAVDSDSAGAAGSGGGGGSAGAVAVAGAGGAQVRGPSVGCRAPAGVSNNPQSIAETITLLNALPKPLTIPCFVESLARPLQMHATFGILSAQPAVGARSPRIFLFLGPNTMSIVPDGVGAYVLEFGEKRENFRSLKGELAFPVNDQVPASAPFDRVIFNDQLTTCGLCHANEVAEPNAATARAFVSQSLRPPARNDVSIPFLQNELANCNRASEPYRCSILDALLSLGPVSETAFPLEMATFE
jgi:hypothetical protein